MEMGTLEPALPVKICFTNDSRKFESAQGLIATFHRGTFKPEALLG